MERMTLNIEITSDLEHQLQQAADQAGISPDAYVLRLLERNLVNSLGGDIAATESPRENRLNHHESELFQTINHSLANIDWQHYETLLTKRDAQTLSANEQTELIAMSDQIELANGDRIQALAELAKIRNTNIQALMIELDLKPITHD
jgi:hypothetical protein